VNLNKKNMTISFFVLLATVLSNPEVTAYAKLNWIGAMSFSAILVLVGLTISLIQKSLSTPVQTAK